jgi:predicted glycosyltransferase
MRILIDVLHPKHVHFFRPLIKRWTGKGHDVMVGTRNKDITHELLNLFHIPYTCLSKQKKGLWMLLELMTHWLHLFTILRNFRPHVVLSIGGIMTSIPCKVMGIPNIALTDTETAKLGNRISFPFADCILTPEWFTEDFGKRHYRYRSFHEWSYLHPDEFQPDPEIVRAEGIDPDVPYAVVRFVRWDALHDRGEEGFRKEDAVRLIQGLSGKMKIVLTAEGALHPEFSEFVYPVHVDRMHQVMAFSRLVVGESPSMCAEASLMGIPSVLASTWAGKCGNMKILSGKFGLMQVYSAGSDAVDAALAIANNLPSRESIQQQRAKLIQDLEYIPEVIERHICALTGVDHV